MIEFPVGIERGGLDERLRLSHSYALSGGQALMPARIRTGDLVQVISGKERTETKKQGKVLAIDSEKGRVRVEGLRMQKRHLKPGRRAARAGGIVEQEGWINASNVMLVDPETGQPSRVGIDTDENGRRIRVFRKSGKPVPTPAGS